MVWNKHTVYDEINDEGCPGVSRRQRVFCGSLCDWLDDEVPIEWLADLLKLIHGTPNLDWLMLSKRPQNFKSRLLEVIAYLGDSLGDGDDVTPFGMFLDWWQCGNEAPHNVWIGTSVEDQARLEERAEHLVSIPAKVHFISAEPLLGPLYFEGDVGGVCDWLIVGGETGPRSRPMNPDWARSLRDQCAAAGVPFFMKQMSGKQPIPEDLQIREYPILK